jgi:vacuolar-type H+-ATPase subunit H
LQPDSLIVTLERLNQLPITKPEKDVLADILRAASNPDNERIDVVIKGLEPERRKIVDKTARQLRAITSEVTSRGRKALEDMTDDEWKQLVQDSLDEQTN